jgi:outer membrane protein
MKKIFISLLIIFGSTLSALESSSIIGVVNFTTCITQSKYGQYEQEQLENIRNQWKTLLSETDKELKDLAIKFEDQDYLDTLSPEAEKELKTKYSALNEDMAKYQNQLYQVLNQANYFFVQKMTSMISKASEQVAKSNKLDMVMNKEACFYSKPEMEVTNLVIEKMDETFSKEQKRLSENTTDKKVIEKETITK